MASWVTHVHEVTTSTHTEGAPHWWTNPAWIQAVLSALAILVSALIAVAVPPVAAGLERRRYRSAALHIGDLLRRTVEYAAMEKGVIPLGPAAVAEELNRAMTELNFETAINNGRNFPAERLESGAGLKAFVRLVGAAQTGYDAYKVLSDYASGDACVEATVRLGHAVTYVRSRQAEVEQAF